MRSLDLAHHVVLVIVGLLWFVAVAWFVLSTSRVAVLLFLISGFFIAAAFAFSTFVMIKTNQPFGMPALHATVALALTAIAFNHEFLKMEVVHIVSMTVIMTLLFFLAVIKIWDSLEFLEQ